ncbi:GntR family transcriptional regulator [Enterococcus sp. DIV0660C]|uniref:GntR family transcriptional regulator n=1 Tax=Enterococcus sp. DIV0660C TaxID=2230880 RepID=UPI001A8EE2E7|nr:GntR family transcriptional regulator [Enterococcus sp. DIV0660C]MBO0432255.1 GntR family transcriptional regulator [Enterococcus sp. DIV0660C]
MASKYEIIKQDIIKKIESGEFSAGEKIYSEGDLKKIYGVSNTTVVKALNDLVNEGYLIRRQGEGTFVRKNLKHRKVFFSEQLSLLNDPKKKSIEKTITLNFGQIKDKYIAQQLGDKTGQRTLVKISQIALTNDRPWKIQNRYLFRDKLAKDSLERWVNGASLSEELGLVGHMSNLPMTMEVRTILLREGMKELEPLKLIDKSFGDEKIYSLFDIRRLISGNDGIPIEYSRSFIHPDFYQIEIVGE